MQYAQTIQYNTHTTLQNTPDTKNKIQITCSFNKQLGRQPNGFAFTR